ncbi:MAG: class I SAM-dependent methyltransferase [Luteolibacter sp.]
MSEKAAIAKKISSLCAGKWMQNYTKTKLKTDPLYDGVYSELQESHLPLLDIGCGMGILAMYLRERGWKNPVAGFDYDPSKIKDGLIMIREGAYPEITLAQGDARTELPEHRGNVTILDIMQFFEDAEQTQLLKSAGARVAPGGKLIIRSGLREKNTRFFITWIGDLFAKFTFWMKAAPIHYPTADFFRKTLESEGFQVEIRPFWGNTPFNNFMILATREE